MKGVSSGLKPGPVPVRTPSRSRLLWFAIYGLVLLAVAWHFARYPSYAMDSLGYMGNALLMKQTDVTEIHRQVYREVGHFPPTAQQDLLGHQEGAPEDENLSRQERARNPYRFAEFLPFFAIRPLYNQSLYYLSESGLGLTRSTIFLAVASYFLVGITLCGWLAKYVGPLLASVMALLLMISPPMSQLGRSNASDGPSTLVAFLALYLIFERKPLALGIALLLIAIYFRTDNVVLAGPVLLALWLSGEVDFWKASVLAALALGSALAINRFAGDYGIQMLYYRNFVGTPLAPAESAVRFSWGQYVASLRWGVLQAVSSLLIPYLLVGIRGWWFPGPLRNMALATLAYAFLHFVILPNWQERWFAILYLSMVVAGASSFPRSREGSLLRSETASETQQPGSGIEAAPIRRLHFAQVHRAGLRELKVLS